MLVADDGHRTWSVPDDLFESWVEQYRLAFATVDAQRMDDPSVRCTFCVAVEYAPSDVVRVVDVSANVHFVGVRANQVFSAAPKLRIADGARLIYERAPRFSNWLSLVQSLGSVLGEVVCVKTLAAVVVEARPDLAGLYVGSVLVMLDALRSDTTKTVMPRAWDKWRQHLPLTLAECLPDEYELEV